MERFFLLLSILPNMPGLSNFAKLAFASITGFVAGAMIYRFYLAIALRSKQTPPDPSKPENKAIRSKISIFDEALWRNSKMVILVRGDLKMGRGKMCAQCGHAVASSLLNLVKEGRWDILDLWRQNGQAKVALKVSSLQEMNDLEEQARQAGLPTQSIRDAGRTQVEPGTKTVCAIGPGLASQIDQVTGRLSLL